MVDEVDANNPQLEALIQEFRKLNHEQKKEKLLGILEYIKNRITYAEWILKFMYDAEDVSDDFMEQNYVAIMATALQSENEEKEKLQSYLDGISSMKQKEEQSQKEENDQADGILNSI